MDIGRHVKESWDLTWKQPGPLIIAGLITMLLGTVSLGILLMPLAAGLHMMYVRVGRGATVEIGDVFAYLNRTVPLLLGAIVLGILIGLGCLLVIPGLIFLAWWMHVLPLMADKGLGLGEAMRRSRAACGEQGLLLSIVFVIVVACIGMVGGLAGGLGAVITVPLSTGALASVYAARKF